MATMNHNEYENSMIEGVNRNFENAEQERYEAYMAYQQERAYLMRRIKSNAAAEIIVMVTGFLSVAIGMCYLSWLSIVSPVLPVAICAVVGLVVGLRLSELARVFRK